MEKMTLATTYPPWKNIADQLPTLEPVVGGNSTAMRGIITTSDGKRLFAKIGVDAQTKQWAKKEIVAYEFLFESNYSHVPKLIAVNDNQTSFATEALEPYAGWDWSDVWTEDRLVYTLSAMDELAQLSPPEKYRTLLKEGMGMDDSANGWIKLQESVERQEYLRNQFDTTEVQEVIANLDQYTDTSLQYKLNFDTLVHLDVRADNCAWNKEQKQVKLVDWNWLQMGDRNIDLAAFLVHVHQNGVNVTKNHLHLLHPQALHFIAGFWFAAASRPIHQGGPDTLRPRQLQSALTALQLSQMTS